MSTSPRDQSSLLWDSPPGRLAPKAKPSEHLWLLSKDGARWSAELLGHGEYGCELQLLRDGEFRYGRRHHLREYAIAEGEHWRRELEAKGWASCFDPLVASKD
jgi:hypothetical protein